MNTYYVYIITNYTNSTLYIGVTNDVVRRVYQHKTGTIKSAFSKKYRLYKLVWFEEFGSITDAIESEKMIKKWRREKKITLIKSVNPNLRDLLSDGF